MISVYARYLWFLRHACIRRLQISSSWRSCPQDQADMASFPADMASQPTNLGSCPKTRNLPLWFLCPCIAWPMLVLRTTPSTAVRWPDETLIQHRILRQSSPFRAAMDAMARTPQGPNLFRATQPALLADQVSSRIDQVTDSYLGMRRPDQCAAGGSFGSCQTTLRPACFC